jgi:hypothetical protein
VAIATTVPPVNSTINWQHNTILLAGVALLEVVEVGLGWVISSILLWFLTAGAFATTIAGGNNSQIDMA